MFGELAQANSSVNIDVVNLFFFFVLTFFCLKTIIKIILFLPSEYVRLGEHNLSTEEDCAIDDDDEPFCAQPYHDIKVQSYVAHPGFSRNTLQDDIGLVKLSQSAQIKQSTTFKG